MGFFAHSVHIRHFGFLPCQCVDVRLVLYPYFLRVARG